MLIQAGCAHFSLKIRKIDNPAGPALFTAVEREDTLCQWLSIGIYDLDGGAGAGDGNQGQIGCQERKVAVDSLVAEGEDTLCR
jgi:hypothetical protein